MSTSGCTAHTDLEADTEVFILPSSTQQFWTLMMHYNNVFSQNFLLFCVGVAHHQRAITNVMYYHLMWKRCQGHSPDIYYSFVLNDLKEINTSSKGKRILTKEMENIGSKHLNTCKQGSQTGFAALKCPGQ